VSSLTLALAAIRDNVAAALVASDPTDSVQVIIGYPVSTELAKIIGQGNQTIGRALVSVFPFGGSKRTTRYAPVPYVTQAPQPGTTATLGPAGASLTIGGTPKAGDTVHAFFAGTQADANHLVTTGETTDQIAAALKASADAYGISGVSTAVTGSTLAITGSFFSAINIGGVGTMAVESARVSRLVGVTVWASDAPTRSRVGEPILAALGGSTEPFIGDANGDGINILYSSDKWDDDPELSYSVYKWMIFYEIEYGISSSLEAAQVESVEVTQTTNEGTPITAFYPGPDPTVDTVTPPPMMI
jgi:hypothetical protein